MKQQEFESSVLSLWTKTRVPLTRANLLVYTKVPRTQMDRWLDEMVRARILELDSDDDGELCWKVRGSSRPARGPASVAEMDTMGRLSAEVDKLKDGASLALRAAGISTPPERVPGNDRKSMLASGLLSFFFGPLGWLYAAPLKEAIPAIIVYAAIAWILPNFLMYMLGMVNIACAVAGVLYAWSYNHEGRRAPLVLKDPPPLPGPGRRS